MKQTTLVLVNSSNISYAHWLSCWIHKYASIIVVPSTATKGKQSSWRKIVPGMDNETWIDKLQ